MASPSLEDRLAINDLFVRYTISLDSFDTEGVISCFVEDCRLVTPIHGDFRGHAGIREWMIPNLRVRDAGGRFRHVISNLVIDVEEDRAKAKCYLLDYLTMPGQPAELLSPGIYECDLVKVGKEWRFTSRVVQMDYIFKLPV
jgi:hypothetical protein